MQSVADPHGGRSAAIRGVPPRTSHSRLELNDVQAWYGESHILHGMSLKVANGECVALLGRNGAGRTTTLRAVMGLVDRRAGSIKIDGVETIAWPTHKIARLGIGFCPEERAIYSSLSCEENLMLPPVVGPSPMSLEEIYHLFPNLWERRRSQGTRLSGGEQQMLAMARILRSGAQLLILDEISEGLAPVIVDKLADTVLELRKRGYTIVLVEQNFGFAAELADRMYLIEHGRVIDHLQQSEVESSQARIEALLGV